MRRNLSELLGRALGGDAEAIVGISDSDHSALLDANANAGGNLVVTREAAVAVLRGLLDQRITPPDAQAWASFVRRGYIAGGAEGGPIRPLEIEFDDAWEDAI